MSTSRSPSTSPRGRRRSTRVIDNLTPETAQKAIESLNNELIEKDATILALQSELQRLQNDLQSSTRVVRREHPLQPVQHMISDKGSSSRMRMGRSASITTSNILEAMPEQARTPTMALCEKIISVFQAPADHTHYLQSSDFAQDILTLCNDMCNLLENEPRVYFLQSPVYIFGDIHGNLEDLHFFADNIWKLGIPLTAGKFLFLGDYVDRGLSGLECTAYLMALKILYPDKIFMLRGNHETREVNGWEDHYGDRSFMWQCKQRFGTQTGMEVWEECNQVFDRLPFAAIIDHDIFCVHGGIPRPTSTEQNRIQSMMAVPAIAAINPPYEHEDAQTIQIASDCIWSDPAPDWQEDELPENGFGDSQRGGGAICFGNQAISDFLEEQNLSYIVRAHEAHAEGVAISKGARVFTVFSTSKDHGQGRAALAGCILVDFDKIQVINRSPAYKNKFVHRRNSTSLAGLDPNVLEERMRLGLIVHEEPDDYTPNFTADDNVQDNYPHFEGQHA